MTDDFNENEEFNNLLIIALNQCINEEMERLETDMINNPVEWIPSAKYKRKMQKLFDDIRGQ